MSAANTGNQGTPTETIAPPKGSSHTMMYAAVAIVVIVVIVLAGAWAAGLFGKSNNSGSGTSSTGTCTLPAAGTLNGAGSSLVAPLMFSWSTTYSASTVNYASVGSGAGIQDITQKTVDFGASDAPLSPVQRSAVTSPGVLTIPESAGAVVPIYNLPTVGTTLKFTGPILASIYLGTMTNWNNSVLQSVNPGVVLPNASIIVVERSDGSGTTFAFTHYLSLENSTWASSVGFATAVKFPVGVGSKGNSGVTTTVKTTADAIGYVDINYALTNSVAFGAVQNPKGTFVVANINNSASAIKDSNLTLPAGNGDWYNVSVQNAPGTSDYPIVTLTYLFVYSDLGKAGYSPGYTQVKAENLVDFLHWIITTGQSQAGGLYYIPLPASIVAADQTTLSEIQYNGAAIPVCVPK